MHSTRPERRRPIGHRTLALAAAVATAGSLLYYAPQSTAMPKPTPPAAPSEIVTQGQVDAKADQKAALSSEVGRLSGEIAAAQIQLQTLQAKAELAEQRFAYAYTQWQAAQAKARAAKQAVEDARREVTEAHMKFEEYVRALYTGGGVTGTAGSLLTAQDPSSLLEQSSLQSYQQQHRADAVGSMEAASIAKSIADAMAQLAEAAAETAKAKADRARQAAEAAVVAEEQQKAALEQQMAGTQAELDQKRAELAELMYGRERTLNYFAKQRAYENQLTEYRAWKQHMEELRLERQQRREERRERREQREHQGNGGGNNGGGNNGGGNTGGGMGSGPSAPSGGTWTAAKGRAAVNRAMSQIGRPYAWAGGNPDGPTYGVCVSGDAWNDCHKVGFDCSGLAMYAWGSWWAHYAATQYSQAGRYHPGAGNLMPGDLIFWSSNGSVWGIHHVAIYIGGGQIVEAPYSGAYVRTASLYEYGGFFGATRPQT